MNKPGHILLGITFFFGYQKIFPYLSEKIEFINWGKFAVFYEKTLYYPLTETGFLLLLTVIGSIVPDYDLYLKEIFNDPKGERRYLYHRQITHSLLLWISLFFYGILTQNVFVFYFALGGLSHLAGDAITGSVPIFLWGKYYSPWRIGVDRIYKNPALYSKLASFLDKAMIIIGGIVIAISLSN